MLPISERMAMAISITNDIICDFLTGMILFCISMRSSIFSKKTAISVCSSALGRLIGCDKNTSSFILTRSCRAPESPLDKYIDTSKDF